MNRIVGFVIFFSIFLVIFLGMNLYVFVRYSRMLGIKRNLTFYVVFAVLTLSFPVTSVLERYFDGGAARILYAASTTWFGAAFLLFCSLLVYEVAHFFVKIKPHTAALVLLAVVFVLVVYSVINALLLEVNMVEVPIPNLTRGVRIAQLSDIHIGTVHNAAYLANIVRKTNSLKPDLVLITGDLVDSSGAVTQSSIAALNMLEAPTFFTTGNHETYAGVDEVVRLLNKTKVRVLRNEVVNYKGVQIVGIDNPDERLANENEVISKIKINRTMPVVLMYHPPLGLEGAQAAGVNLQLSGHTHNGQIAPFNLITRLFYPRLRGLYSYKGTYLYTSQGTGTWGPPMRLGSRNEIALIELVKK